MSFNKSRHAKYWRMCANVLPDHYISGDASRMFLGFFIVGGLDLIHGLDDVKSEERQGWIDWIYHCQVPDGGFRGFPGTNLQGQRSTLNEHWDPANVPNSFFGLACLLILGDDLAGINREAWMQWLPKLQRQDGSFGEILGEEDSIEGGRDLRYCCCAAGIAYILSDPATQPYWPIFDEDRLIDYISSCQNYNGGYGESPLREPHSGLNYCAIATLGLLARLNGPAAARANAILGNSTHCIRWMMERQTTVIFEEAEAWEEGSDGDQTNEDDLRNRYFAPADVVGFSGRDNKIADTCYCFWNAGALAILGVEKHINIAGMRQYLLEKTQHTIGGFGKGPGGLPDVLHSYLALAALALSHEGGIKRLDPALCISKDAAKNLDNVVWRRRRS